MNELEIIEKLKYYVKLQSDKRDASHDYQHILRVYNNALLLAKKEEIKDTFLIKVVALLHDETDYKYFPSDKSAKDHIFTLLGKNGLDDIKIQEKIFESIEQISFLGGKNISKSTSEVVRIVQDADRLDALGAIGIARTFHYGGKKGNLMYCPTIPPNLEMTTEEYKKNNGTTINHFYEKLLKLQNSMQTKTGKQMAMERTNFMKDFLKQFYTEWNISDDKLI
jgi:uncharacterized protein